eukprot:scaffold14707_cov176-Ochromonas_danica.AAC.2
MYDKRRQVKQPDDSDLDGWLAPCDKGPFAHCVAFPPQCCAAAAAQCFAFVDEIDNNSIEKNRDYLI